MLFRGTPFLLLIGLATAYEILLPRGTETTETSESTTEFSPSGPTLDAPTLEATILGTYSTTRKERQIYAYKGLPYTDGQPERFKIATVAGPFQEKTFDATSSADVCLQRNPRFKKRYVSQGSEDCLYLNVYTPVKTPGRKDKLPVMVYFHGGNFISGDTSDYQPTYLLDEDVLLVVPNYRLGSLSFFTTTDNKAPGNLALYDQMVALEWVQAYIADFGGDPERVTIFGQEAGGVSVNYHILSQNSPNFHGAIAQSGSALDEMAFDATPLETSYLLATVIPDCEKAVDGINPDNSALSIAAIYNCMSGADSKDLAVAYDKLQDSYNGSGWYPYAAPSAQTDSSITQKIVSKPPLEASVDTQITTVPLIIGNVAQEGSLAFGKMFSRYLGPYGKADDEDYVQYDMVPDLLEFMGISDPTRTYSKSLSVEYLSYTPFVDFVSYCSGMIDMVGSLFFKSGTMETARLQSSLPFKNGRDVFVYSFDYEGNTTLFDSNFEDTEFPPVCSPGVSRSDDLLYLFGMADGKTEEDYKIVEKMVTLWTLFAKYKDPTPIEAKETLDALGIPTWNSFDSYSPAYMSVSGNIVMNEDYSASWTITGDAEKREGTEIPVSTPSPYDIEAILEKYNDVQDERDAYLITMTIFIVLFVVTLATAIYFFMQSRR